MCAVVGTADIAYSFVILISLSLAREVILFLAFKKFFIQLVFSLLSRRRTLSRKSLYPELLLISIMTSVGVLFKEQVSPNRNKGLSNGFCISHCIAPKVFFWRYKFQGIMLPTVFLACNVIYAHRGFQSLTPLPRVKKGNKVFYTKLLFYLCILLPTILYLRLALVGFRTPKFKEQGTVVSRFICLSYPLITINLSSQFQNIEILF